ncbi:Hypp623 [Branchiostoma lanceolatum]|uniref:Hypp623 protein n=1 Tax=Branchiostoma lanceolatum TaxID=7740 RepID=A0A8J9VN82_BRALA|nr:Hypp623 [Branchiostoma lanceolatum]
MQPPTAPAFQTSPSAIQHPHAPAFHPAPIPPSQADLSTLLCPPPPNSLPSLQISPEEDPEERIYINL